MKSHAAFPTEPYVEDEAARPCGVRRPEKFVRGLERFDAQAYRAQKQVEGLPDSLVVIDDIDDRTVVSCGFSPHSVVRPAVICVPREAGTRPHHIA
jgi:hypothetical protein